MRTILQLNLCKVTIIHMRKWFHTAGCVVNAVISLQHKFVKWDVSTVEHVLGDTCFGRWISLGRLVFSDPSLICLLYLQFESTFLERPILVVVEAISQSRFYCNISPTFQYHLFVQAVQFVHQVVPLARFDRNVES